MLCVRVAEQLLVPFGIIKVSVCPPVCLRCLAFHGKHKEGLDSVEDRSQDAKQTQIINPPWLSLASGMKGFVCSLNVFSRLCITANISIYNNTCVSLSCINSGD